MRRRHGVQSMNYMDDDTCEVMCRCGWESTGHDDEGAAEAAVDDHARDEGEEWWS